MVMNGIAVFRERIVSSFVFEPESGRKEGGDYWRRGRERLAPVFRIGD
jgi:hypothetical protein